MKPGDLTYFYIDDSDKTQGPFDAGMVQQWLDRDQLRDDIRMRFTDNGKLIGDEITYEATLGQLKKQFGGDVLPKATKDLKIRGVHISPSNEGKTIMPLPPLEIADEDDSVWLSDGHETPSPRKRAFAGPELPPDYEKKKIKAESPGKVRKTSSSLASRLTSPYSKSGSTRKHSKKIDQHLPFYDGSFDDQKTRMPQVIATELALYLQIDYSQMNKRDRDAAHIEFGKMELPKICKICSCPLVQPTNFLSHVISQGHISKCLGTTNIQFTFEDDYLKLKNLFKKREMEKRKPSVSVSSYLNPSPRVTRREHCTSSRDRTASNS